MKYNDVKAVGMRSRCPVAGALDVIGDKWTLLIIRDMLMLGAGQYQDFLRAPEKISTNILADRLKKLEAAGVIQKRQYQNNPVRYLYSLTPMGEDLRPVMMALVKWGGAHIDGSFAPSEDQIKQIEDKIRKRA